MQILSVTDDKVLVLHDCEVKNQFPREALKGKKICRGCKKEIILTEEMVKLFLENNQPKPPPVTPPPPPKPPSFVWMEVLADANTAPQRIQLTEGKHVIGRLDSARTASIPFKTDDLYVHRQHCCLEVLKTRNGDWECILSKHPSEQNGTFLNTRQIVEGEETYLKNGDLVRLSDVIVRFVIPEPVNRKPKDKTIPINIK